MPALAFEEIVATKLVLGIPPDPGLAVEFIVPLEVVATPRPDSGSPFVFDERIKIAVPFKPPVVFAVVLTPLLSSLAATVAFGEFPHIGKGKGCHLQSGSLYPPGQGWHFCALLMSNPCWTSVHRGDIASSTLFTQLRFAGASRYCSL